RADDHQATNPTSPPYLHDALPIYTQINPTMTTRFTVFFAILRWLRAAITTNSHMVMTPSHKERSEPIPAVPRSSKSWAANDPRITAIELKNSIRTTRRRE